jgi:hypothetical protein
VAELKRKDLLRLSCCREMLIIHDGRLLVLGSICIVQLRATDGKYRSMELSEGNLGSSFLIRALGLSRIIILSRGLLFFFVEMRCLYCCDMVYTATDSATFSRKGHCSAMNDVQEASDKTCSTSTASETPRDTPPFHVCWPEV